MKMEVIPNGVLSEGGGLSAAVKGEEKKKRNMTTGLKQEAEET